MLDATEMYSPERVTTKARKLGIGAKRGDGSHHRVEFPGR